MPLLLILTSAALAAPVTVAELQDTERWQRDAKELLNGPDGCIEVQGIARTQFSLYLPGGWLSGGERKDFVAEGAFTGRLEDGVWTELSAQWKSDDEEAEEAMNMEGLHLIVGRKPDKVSTKQTESDDGQIIAETTEETSSGSLTISSGSGGAQVAMEAGSGAALNLLDELLDELSPEVVVADAYWNDQLGAVVLTQLHGFSPKHDLQVTTHFPGGGGPTRIDAVFPDRMTFREGPVKLTVREGQLHVRGRQTEHGVVPGSEGVSVVVGMLGFTAGIDQRVVYERFRPCPAP